MNGIKKTRILIKIYPNENPFYYFFLLIGKIVIILQKKGKYDDEKATY
jgi:hypothetical protein